MTAASVRPSETDSSSSAPTNDASRAPPLAYSTPASDAQIGKTVRSLEANGIQTIVVETTEDARKTVERLLPPSAEVFASTSRTLEISGIAELIDASGRYQAVRPMLKKLHEDGKDREARMLGAAPEYIVGSVHAVTESGQVVIASASGSQIPAYAAGAAHIIWVVGTQKIVPDLDAAFRRIYEYTLPLESTRAHEAYGVPGSFVSKLLVINREFAPQRATLIFVKENVGF